MNNQRLSILCSDCKKIINPPVWQCKNRHIYCSNCLSSSCSICSESLITLSRNHSIEDIIKTSEDLACVYSTEGCDFTGCFVDLSHHQITCEYSDLQNQCVYKSCTQKLRKKMMIDHILHYHNANPIIKTEGGKFQVEIFKQLTNEEEWKNFQWRPFLYKREIDDEEKIYLLKVWAEEWVFNAEVHSLTHESEPIRYMLTLPKDKISEDNKQKYILISNTISYKHSAPVLSLPVSFVLKNFGFVHKRGDIKAVLLQFHLPNKDFYDFN